MKKELSKLRFFLGGRRGNRALLCVHSWPGAHRDLTASASLLLRLKVCAPCLAQHWYVYKGDVGERTSPLLLPWRQSNKKPAPTSRQICFDLDLPSPQKHGKCLFTSKLPRFRTLGYGTLSGSTMPSLPSSHCPWLLPLHYFESCVVVLCFVHFGICLLDRT